MGARVGRRPAGGPARPLPAPELDRKTRQGARKGRGAQRAIPEPEIAPASPEPVRQAPERQRAPLRSGPVRPPRRHPVGDHPDRPPYRIPTMAEIAAVKPNGFRVVTTFAGCGGSSLGYRMAGFKIAWASEFVPAAREVYELNAAPGTIVDDRDIRKVDPAEILAAIGLEPGELDLLDGSPPCASFSTAGKREAHWGQEKSYSDTRQRTDDLFPEFIRILRGLRPRTFVAENVSGLAKGVAIGVFKELLVELRASGYRVEARMLDAQWLGVPQQRQRLIFVGVRDDLALDPAFPVPLPYRYSVRDALPHTGQLIVRGQNYQGHVSEDAGSRPVTTIRSAGKAGPWQQFVTDQPEPVGGRVVALNTSKGLRSVDLPAPTIMTMGRRRTQTELTAIERGPDISDYAIGPAWAKLKPGEASERYFNLIRSDFEQPVQTVTATGGSSPGTAGVTHPSEPRKFSMGELRRLCGFPDDFVLTGTYAQQWERLGRAVPPPMMRAVAETIRDEILQRADLRPRRRRAIFTPGVKG